MTDWAYEEAGWWIENVMVNDVPLDMSLFAPLIPPPAAEFMVTLTNADGSYICDLDLDDLNDGTFDLSEFNDDFLYLVVSAVVGMADYELDFN